MYAFEQSRRQPRHFPAGGHRARKSNDGNIGVDNELASDVSAAGQDVEDVRRKTRLLEKACEGDTAADSRPRIRLQHHRIADRQCRPPVPARVPVPRV
jgi:hypothetical protein